MEAHLVTRKMNEEQRLCFGFPHWLIQVGANLDPRQIRFRLPRNVATVVSQNQRKGGILRGLFIVY